MKWPWVSRALLDRADEELQRVLEQIVQQQNVIADLQTHNIRLARKDAGLPEEPRQSKPRDDEPVPVEVRDYLEAFDSMEMRANVEDDMRMARAQGTPWSEIIKLIATMEDQDVLP